MKKILHIFPYEKFTFDYITKIERCFDPSAHSFYIYGKKQSDAIKECREGISKLYFVETVGVGEAVKLIKGFSNYDKIILHSLFIPPMLLIAFSCIIKNISSKVFWVIWGADLYDTYWSKDKNVMHKIRELFRKHFIKYVKAVGYIPSDYAYLKKCYETDAKFYLASYSYDFFDIPEKSKEDDTINILVGNSATESCQHTEAIDLISSLGLKNVKLWCVLSYPHNKSYIEKVALYGKETFGDRFIPLVDFMPYENYMEMLSNIDIAIFNNNRQQALGNIAGLLFYGKTVFVNPKNGCLDYFKQMGATIFSTEEFSKELVTKLHYGIKEKNQRIILKFFSDNCFAERWRKIFESEF